MSDHTIAWGVFTLIKASSPIDTTSWLAQPLSELTSTMFYHVKSLGDSQGTQTSATVIDIAKENFSAEHAKALMNIFERDHAGGGFPASFAVRHEDLLQQHSEANLTFFGVLWKLFRCKAGKNKGGREA